MPRNDDTTGRSHPRCWDGTTYHHTACLKPSGRTCIEVGCDEPAGTRWGPYWCPAHDVARLDRVGASLQSIADDLAARKD